MGLAYTKESAYAQERAKHEAFHTEFGPPGRPYTHQDYPMRLSLAGRNASGVPVIVHAVTVADDHERRNFESRGYRAGQDVALAHLHATDLEIAELAANRAFHDRRICRRFPRNRNRRGAGPARSPKGAPMPKPKPVEYPKMVYVNGVGYEAKDAAHEYLLTHPEAAAKKAEAEKQAAEAEAERVEKAEAEEEKRKAKEEADAAKARDHFAAEAEAKLAADVKAAAKADTKADAPDKKGKG
jgi:hypothetical protein